MAVKSVVIRQKPRISEEDYRKKLGLKRLNEFGQEIPDRVPMEPPVGFKKQPSIFENMREMVKAELARKAIDEGFDTEDDDNNFDIPEDRDPLSKHEYTEMDEERVTTTAAAINKKISDDKAAAKAAMAARSSEPPKAGQGPAEPAREALDAPKGSDTPKK